MRNISLGGLGGRDRWRDWRDRWREWRETGAECKGTDAGVVVVGRGSKSAARGRSLDGDLGGASQDAIVGGLYSGPAANAAIAVGQYPTVAEEDDAVKKGCQLCVLFLMGAGSISQHSRNGG